MFLKMKIYQRVILLVWLGVSAGFAHAATDCNQVTEIPVSECQSLLELYNSTNGANWKNKTGWNQTNTPCSWFGIRCSGGYVQSISLKSNQLSGSVPNFNNLPNLFYLNFELNQLSGSIPNFTNLPKLIQIYLPYNQLSGDIPNFTNLPNLALLDLASNQLSGSIPNFTNLPKLTYLGLGSNQLSGSIPNFTNLPKLTYLGLGSNQLSGSIPNFTSFNLANLSSAGFYSNCGLTAYDSAQETILNQKDYYWKSNNTACSGVTMTVSKTGDGTVSATGINCGTDCSKTYNANTVVVLTATPNAGFNFVNWSGDCGGAFYPLGSTVSPLSVTMDKSKNCTANFAQKVERYSLNQNTISIGYDHTKHATPLTLSGELKDNLVTFTVKKTDGSAFTQNGTLYLKVGSFEKYGAVRTSKPVKQGDLQITFDAVNNDNYPNYPKMYFARFESSETAYHAYAGPIIVSKRDDSTSTSTFNGNIASYLDGDKLIFEYVDPENDYKGGLSWYVNDDLVNAKATGKQLVVSAPTLFNANPIYYVTLKSDANEWLYSYPPLKDTYEFASFRNYTFKVAKGKKDKAVVVSVGDTLFEVTANGEFIPFTGQQLNRGHNTDFNLPLGNISSFSNTPITIFEGVENDGYKTPDVPALGLDVKSKQLVNIDRLTDFLNRKPNTRRSNISTSALDNALDELERSNLLPDDFKPSNIRSESVKLALDIMAIHTGMEGVKNFLDKVSSFAGNVGEIANMLISFQELSIKLDQADIEGKPEGIKSLYVLSYLFDETPLKKFLVLHSLIQSITQQIEQLDKILNEAKCSDQVGKVKLSIYEDINWWPDRVMSEIEQVQLFPIQLYYGDYPNIKTTDVLKPLTGKETVKEKAAILATRSTDLDQRANYAVTLKQEGEYWTFGSSSPSLAQGVIDFSSSPTYCGAWMVVAKAGDKMYYGRTTLRSDHNEPSKIVVSPSN